MSYILDALRKADAQRERDPARGIHAQPGRPSMGESPRRFGLRAGILTASAAGIVALAVVGWYLYRDPVPAADRAQVAAGPAAQPLVAAVPPVVPSPVVLPPPVVVSPTVASTPPAVVSTGTPPSRMERPTGSSPAMPGQVGVGATARAMAQAAQGVPPPARPGMQPPGQPPAQAPTVAPAAPNAANGSSAAVQPGVPVPQMAAPPQTTPMVPNVAPQPAPYVQPYVPPVAVPPAPPPAPVAGLPSDAPKLVITGGVYTANKAQRMLIVNGQVMTEGADLGSGVMLEEIRPKSAVLRFRGGRYAVTY